MRNLIIFSIVSILAVLNYSCNELDDEAVSKYEISNGDFIVKNGYLKFNNSACFLNTVSNLSNMKYEDIVKWKSKYPFVSLQEMYDNRSALLRETNDSTLLDSNELSSIVLTNLFNERGILLIGDTIIKINGELSCVIVDGDFNTLQSIEMGADLSELKNVKIENHTIKLSSGDDDVQLRSTQRTIVHNVSSKRREYVSFTTEVNNVNGMLFLYADMRGHAQTKDLFWWGFNFADEFVSAKLSVNCGYYTYDTNPTTQYSIASFSSGVVTGVTIVDYNLPLGLLQNCDGVSVNNFVVTYDFNKDESWGAQTRTITWNESY
jgi:hypothetical protein